ncbi:hypothetical protein [Lutibacter maritimus]|uniref:Uncharacterized protein n=1 Tax=Lutibacter maritimus TaxID=593133 RepID=A0A1I6S2A6_9FLAO|nr:hypothetical protein [Lutibacter maritimus]SFS71095.1 hypothetical protein SAMN04488006_2751 [Lutibacter maritimus]
MQRNIFKNTSFTCFLLALLFSFSIVAQETTVDDYKLSFSFKTIKKFDNTRVLEVTFIGKNREDRKDKIPVFDAEIKFFNIANDEEILLGTAKTSNEGIAQLVLSEKQKYLTDEDGYINLTARFEGSDVLDAEEEEILVKDLHLELNLEEIDSVKTIFVKAFTIDSLGVQMPVEEVDVIVSIEGMLSKMKIKEGTIENGEIEFELLQNIPGDVDKNFTVYAQILDNDEFGDVIQKQTVNWGTFNKLNTPDKNKLWSEAAPIWMYIVLTILLVGVWANYMYTIYNLYKIKKEGKKINISQEEE